MACLDAARAIARRGQLGLEGGGKTRDRGCNMGCEYYLLGLCPVLMTQDLIVALGTVFAGLGAWGGLV